MEANEAQELQENAEHGSSESSLRPVAFTMSVLAVLVAVTTVLGHRTHTEAVLDQNKGTDQWNEYQAHKIRSNNTSLATDLLSVVTVSDKDAAQKIRKSYTDHQAKWADETKDEYFASGKMKLKSFTLDNIKYSDKFDQATVTTTITRDWEIRMQTNTVTLPMVTTWKLVLRKSPVALMSWMASRPSTNIKRGV